MDMKDWISKLNIKPTGKTKTENINWENYFLMMKRWYYRLRDTDYYNEDGFSINQLKMEEDYYWTIFIIIYHFKDWIRMATSKEKVENYVKNSKSLSICADICNSNKHLFLRYSKTGDKETRLLNTLIEAEYKNKKSFFPITLIINRHKMIDAYTLVEDCMQDWGKFIINEHLKIPILKEENSVSNFVKWEPKLK